MSYVVSVRISEKEVWEKAKLYAKENGLTIGKLVVNALEFYMEREDRILKEIEELRNEIRAYLKSPYKPLEKSEGKEIVTEAGLPSYFKDNPWVEILARRGLEE